MKSLLAFLVLALVKIASQLFFRFRGERLDSLKQPGWSDLRLLVFLNHTSLYEPLVAAFAPFPLLWRFAFHGVLPVAEKTIRRRIGLFFQFLARHVVVVTRQRDQTWDEVLNRVDRKAVVMILPEGRMMRRSIRDHSAPCPRNQIPGRKKARQFLLGHLEEKGYDVSSLKGHP